MNLISQQLLLILLVSGSVLATAPVMDSVDNNISVEQGHLFESKAIKTSIPAIIINKNNSLKPSTKKFDVEIEDPDWGIGEQIIVSFNAKNIVVKVTPGRVSVDQTTVSPQAFIAQRMTVRQAIVRIKAGERVDRLTIPFSTYVKIGGANRKTLGNRIVIRGDDGLDYHLYHGRVTTQVPVDIDTLLILIAEAIQHDKVVRLKYLRGRSVPMQEGIAKILQLAETTPFSKEQNLQVGLMLGIDSDIPEYLTLLDIYAALGGRVITKNNELPRIASYPRPDDSPHRLLKAGKTNFYSEYGDYVIIRHGATFVGRELKSWFGGRSTTSLFHALWMFADWKHLDSSKAYDSWKEKIVFKPKLNNDECIVIGDECINL